MIRNIVTIATAVLAAGICHAAPSFVTAPIPVRVTHVPEWYRPTTSRLCFTALSVDPYYVPPTTNQLASGAAPVRSQLLPVASWILPNGSFHFPASVALLTQGKNIVSGNYIIECWLDLNDDGKFNPGEPYGCDKVYGLTPTNDISRIDIELLEVSPIIARMDLSTMVAAMPATTNSLPAFSPLAAATDSGIWSVPYSYVSPAETCGTNKPMEDAKTVRIRVVRTKINRTVLNDITERSVLIDRYFDFSIRSVLTEADVLADDLIDLDLSSPYLPGVVRKYSHYGALTNVSYSIVVGDGLPDQFDQTFNNLPVTFTKVFQFGDLQPPTTNHEFFVITNISMSATNIYPTFRWSHNNSINKPYPGFELFISSSTNIDFFDPTKYVLHNTKVQTSPKRSESGMYEYTLPLNVGDPMIKYDGENQIVTGIFTAGSNYWWSVSMSDAKYFYPLANNEPRIPFFMPSFTNNTPLSH